MRTATRSRPPQWLIVAIAVVGILGVLAAAVKYRNGANGAPGAGHGNRSGPAGRALTAASLQGTARSVQVAGWIGLPSFSIDMGDARWSVSTKGAPVEGTGTVTVQGDGIVASVFRAVVTPSGATFESRDGRIRLPDGTLVNGTAVHGNNLVLTIDTNAHPWLDAPAAMELRAVDQFSWAGSGDVTVGDQHRSSEFMGAMGSLTIDLTRTADAVSVTGSGGVQQVFVDGQPALKTTATIDRLRTDIKAHAGDTNDSTYVTWAPRDTGSFGACILRIVPRSGHAEWVNVGLQHMPPMFGGEQHAPVGGDTSELGDHGRLFGGPDAIDSFINVGDADRRDLSVSVPAGTAAGVYPIEIALEGNFEPVVFSMTVTVAG